MPHLLENYTQTYQELREKTSAKRENTYPSRGKIFVFARAEFEQILDQVAAIERSEIFQK